MAMNVAARCYHGAPVTSPCSSCEAEGYTRCQFDGCRKLFTTDDHRERYCSVSCRGKAAYQRQMAREQTEARGMA